MRTKNKEVNGLDREKNNFYTFKHEINAGASEREN